MRVPRQKKKLEDGGKSRKLLWRREWAFPGTIAGLLKIGAWSGKPDVLYLHIYGSDPGGPDEMETMPFASPPWLLLVHVLGCIGTHGNHLHHAAVLMNKNVAVQHELARKIHEA